MAYWPIETRVELPDWEKDPREVWCQTEQRNPLGVELQREWGRQERPDDEWIEDFVLRFTAACLESGDGSASRERERPKRRCGRAGEKRRRYADTLELFKRCPARLGDLVRRNDPRSFTGRSGSAPSRRGQGGIPEAMGQCREIRDDPGRRCAEVRKRLKKLKLRWAPGREWSAA